MRTYKAYISYNHADAKFASWLQRELENYRVPQSMDAQFERFPLRPVFRDRADLRSAADLGATLTEALQHSAALIVVCSESAAQSQWVAQEIEMFRAQHGAARIFAIIARDAPPDCFPAALVRGTGGEVFEPIAADARPELDGHRDAFLKIVAALLDVDFDALKRRDQQRKQRRMTVITAGSTLLATAMLTLAITASNARDEAELRRAQADDLIGFMLGDLRSKLEPIGRLDVLDAVGDKALDYFAGFAANDLDPAPRLEHARALRQIGEVRVAQGDLESAMLAFTQSNSQTLTVYGETDSNDALFELGQSHFWVGYAYYASKQLDSAERHFSRYLEIAQQLAARQPDNQVYQVEVGYAHSNLGTLAVEQNRYEVAEENFLKMAAINQAQLLAKPGDTRLERDRAETMSWLARIASNTRPLGVVVARYREELRLRRSIARRSDDELDNSSMANTGLLLGHQLVLTNQPSEAAAVLTESLEVADRLVDHDPGNSGWRRTRASLRMELARVRGLAARPGAPTLAQAAADEMRELAADDPSNKRRQLNLVSALTQVARFARLQSDSALLGRSLNELGAILRDYEMGAGPEERSIIARYYLLAGDNETGADQSRVLWSRGMACLDTQGESRQPAVLLTRLALAQRLGLSTEAQSAKDALRRIEFADSQKDAIVSTLVTGTFLTDGT